MLPEQRAKRSETMRGKSKTEQHVLNIVTAQARRHRTHPTKWETALRRLLRGVGFVCRYERRFGRYSVDAYVPSRRLAFEADGHGLGHYTKRDSGYEEARDLYLMAEHGLLAVIHLSKDDLRPFL